MADTLLLDPVDEVIARYTSDTPVDVTGLAHAIGLPIHTELFDEATIAGKIVRVPSGSPAGFSIYVNGRDNPRRQRFTIAHEIAHYLLHRDLIGDGLIDDALYRSKLSDNYERQANRMAADILMPAALVRGLFKGGTKHLSGLSEILDLSESAIRIRLDELGLGA